MEPTKADLLAHLEDVPALVEVRGLLRRRGTSLVMGEGRPLSGFVLAPEHDLAAGFGEPEPGLADRLAEAAQEADVDRARLRLRAEPGVMEAWCVAGAARSAGRVEVLSWAGYSVELVALSERHEVQLVEEGDALAEDLPAAMRRELEALESWPAAAVALAGGEPVALAYAFVETEALWDVSVETEAPFRREGFGASAAAALMLEQARAGRSAIWSVASTNSPSLALAERLGFVPAARWADGRLA